MDEPLVAPIALIAFFLGSYVLSALFCLGVFAWVVYDARSTRNKLRDAFRRLPVVLYDFFVLFFWIDLVVTFFISSTFLGYLILNNL